MQAAHYETFLKSSVKTNGPAYLIPILGLVYYHYAPLLSFEGSKKWWLAIPLAFGLVFVFIDKITLLYSIPSEFKNPCFQVIWPAVKAGNFNNESILTRLFGSNNDAAASIYILFFAMGIFMLFLYQRKTIANSSA